MNTLVIFFKTVDKVTIAVPNFFEVRKKRHFWLHVVTFNLKKWCNRPNYFLTFRIL
jgi:hypothetical protein